MGIKSEKIVAEVVVRDRVLTVTRIDWTNTTGLSYDVRDKATGLCLTAESMDEQPGFDELHDLLDRLDDDLEYGELDDYFAGTRQELAEVLGIRYWASPGCGSRYRESDADQIVDHVRDCDAVDGAGHPR